MMFSLSLKKKNPGIKIFILILLILIPACSKKKVESEVQNPEQVSASILPVESPDSYEKDIEDYEPTDSISQDSDGAVH
jgi:ABC-type phosphate/phosphonate transport system substrate-binding protein